MGDADDKLEKQTELVNKQGEWTEGLHYDPQLSPRNAREPNRRLGVRMWAPHLNATVFSSKLLCAYIHNAGYSVHLVVTSLAKSRGGRQESLGSFGNSVKAPLSVSKGNIFGAKISSGWKGNV